MADPEGKERLTNSEFRELIPHLPLADLLLIEIRKEKEKWQKLIYIVDAMKKLYGCTLCNITNSNAKNLNAHMDGRKHKINMNDIQQFFHPEYTYLKYQQRLAEGGPPLPKNSKKAAKPQSSTSVSKSTVAKVVAAVSGKNVTSATKAPTPKSKPVAIIVKPEKIEESKTESAATNNSVVLKANSGVKPAEKSSTTIATSTKTTITPKSSQTISKVKPVPQKDDEQINDKSEKPMALANVALDDKDKDKLTQIPNDPNKPVEPMDEDVIIISEENDTKMAENTCAVKPNDQVNLNSKEEKGSNQSKLSTNDGKTKNAEQTNLVKNPFAHGNTADAEKKPMPKISVIATALLQEPKLFKTEVILKPEVIVIDDEPPASEQDDTTMVGRKIPIVEKRAVSKQQRPLFPIQIPSVQNIDHHGILKRPTTEMSANKNIVLEEPQTKKSKVVINPAAAFLNAATNEQKKGTMNDNNETPNYQKDKVIIPTVDKNKNNNKNQQATNKRNEPTFATKTFSSRAGDDDIHGLLGVEYVVKIMKNRNDRSPRYECSLCELILDGPSMQSHLVGYNHRMNFCEKHFPTAISQYKQYCAKIPLHETYKVLTPILGKLALAIEKHHGRDLPYECLESDFNLNRHAILSKLFSCRHASEQNGPSFTHVVDSKEIDKYITQKDFFKPQSGPHEQVFLKRHGPSKNDRPSQRESRRPIIVEQPHEMPQERPQYSFVNYVAPVDDDIHKRMVEDFLRGTVRSRSPHGRHHGRNRERRSRRSRERERDRDRDVLRSRSRLDNEHKRKSISPLRDGDIWQAYRHVVDRKINELNEVFKLYHSDPETHPMYNEEWQKFWKRRKDELIAAGLDHRSYNYQPEWVRYFKVRIEELYSQAVENIKIQARERLCLPMDNTYLDDPKYHVQVVDDVYGVTPSLDNHSNDGNNESLTLPANKEKKSTTEVVPVLRLMTALEEHLGSLGPRIIDLMSKALLEEKTHPTEANVTILTLENCTLLETAMEKLKGVLYAGLLDGPKERAFKKVITDTGALLAFAEEERKKNPPKPKVIPPTVSNKPSYASTQPARSSAPVPVLLPAPVPAPQTSQASAITKGPSSAIPNLIAQMDRKELAAKIAATLTAQGKTDFSHEYLEQLIAVYTLIEKKKREQASDAIETTIREPVASSTTRATLSDTLANFMNPSNPNSAPVISKKTNQSSSATVPVDSSAKKAYTVATVNRYLDVMRRSGGNVNSSDTNANDIWQNLQNIQRGLNISNVNPNQNLSSQSSSGENLSSNSSQSNNFGVMNLTQLGFQTQNPYLAMTAPSQSYFQQSNENNFNMQSNYNYLGNMSGAGNLFTNAHNSSRVDTNNISINTVQSSQRMESLTQPNPNQKWRENLIKNQNARGGGGSSGGGSSGGSGGGGGGGVGGSKKNGSGKNKGGVGGGGGGQNKNRNFRKR